MFFLGQSIRMEVRYQAWRVLRNYGDHEWCRSLYVELCATGDMDFKGLDEFMRFNSYL